MGVKMSEEKISADVSLNHEVPSFLCVGFSGRKTADTSRPTVLGQVADLSQLNCFNFQNILFHKI